MGRMKEIYIEIKEKYGDKLPEDFSLGQYQFNKELEYEEIREIEERFKQSQSTSTNDSKGLSGD
jgi:predicted nuclease with TOPRIM domain